MLVICDLKQNKKDFIKLAQKSFQNIAYKDNENYTIFYVQCDMFGFSVGFCHKDSDYARLGNKISVKEMKIKLKKFIK